MEKGKLREEGCLTVQVQYIVQVSGWCPCIAQRMYTYTVPCHTCT